MPTLDILVQGYAKKEGDVERASSSAVLVRDKGLNLIVDPGCAKERLAEAMQKINLKPEDINFVLLTHYHPDHAVGAGWFPKAKIIDDEYIYEDDKMIKHDGFIPDSELAIMHTPGHSLEHCSLAVPTAKGIVVVAGDVFWWYDHEQQSLDVHKPDPFAQDHDLLVESRQKVLKLADIIIPGHGSIISGKMKAGN